VISWMELVNQVSTGSGSDLVLHCQIELLDTTRSLPLPVLT
jgi:hypothetical protein